MCRWCYEKKRRAERKNCVHCERPRVEGRRSCMYHLEYSRQYQRERRAERSSKGVCTYCDTPRNNGRAVCVFHALILKKSREKRQYRTA